MQEQNRTRSNFSQVNNHEFAWLCIMISAIMLALGLLCSKKPSKVDDRIWDMALEKLSGGVLRVLTPLGPRYLRPSFLQRIYLLWIFRNFETLPVKVLSASQQRRIEAMCTHQGFVSMLEPNGVVDTPILGTLEQRPPLEAQDLPARRPSASLPDAVSPLAADHRS